MDTIDLDKIANDPDVPKEVLEVYTVLKAYKEHPDRAKWEKTREDNWDAVSENEMWDDSEKDRLKKQKQPPLVINKCNKGVQGACALVTDQRPEIKFLPVGSGDLYVAELMKRAHDHVWAKNNGNDRTYDVVEECKIGGIGFSHIRHDRSRGGMFGSVVFSDDPPDDIFWSPNSRERDLSDSHIIKAKQRTKTYIKKHYPGIKDEDLEFRRTDLTEPGSSKSEGLTSGDSYTQESGNPDSGSNPHLEAKEIWEIEAWMIDYEQEEMLLYALEGEGGVEAKLGRKGPRHKDIDALAKELGVEVGEEVGIQKGRKLTRTVEKRVQKIIVGKKLVSSKVNPYGADSDGNPILGIQPLTHDRTRTGFPTCPTTKAVPVNKEKNKRRIQFMAAADHNILGPLLQPADMVKWAGEIGAPGSVGNVDPKVWATGVLPQRMASADINIVHFANLEQMADRDIDDQYDVPDVLRGKMPEGKDKLAWQSVHALQDSAGMMSKPFMRRLESFLVRQAKVVMAILLKTQPRAFWMRLLEDDEMATWTPQGPLKPPGEGEEDGQEQMRQQQQAIAQKWLKALNAICPNELPGQGQGMTILDFDVRMVAGSSMPTNRMAKLQTAIELVGAGLYDREAALEYIDDPMKDKVVERMAKMEQAAMQAEMMKKAGGK